MVRRLAAKPRAGRFRTPLPPSTEGRSPPLGTHVQGLTHSPLHLHRTMDKRPPFDRAQGEPPSSPETSPWSGVSPLNHAQRDFALPCTPSTEGRFAAPRDPRAGLGAFPLHLHRTMDEKRSVVVNRLPQQIR